MQLRTTFTSNPKSTGRWLLLLWLIASWLPLQGQVPSGRYKHSAVWTGKEMIVWGGQDSTGASLNTGGRFNPLTGTWVATSTNSAPIGRNTHRAVWTGSEMIIWGGERTNNVPVNDGARYDPLTDSWTPLSTNNAPDPRKAHAAVWTGSEMVIWGGIDFPKSLSPLNDGARIAPTGSSWQMISSNGAPALRVFPFGFWTGTRMLIWGGTDGSQIYYNTGGLYDPVQDAWQPTSTNNPPVGRNQGTAVWTGNEMIIWGGSINSTTYPDTGGRYSSQTDSWQATSTNFTPGGRISHTAVWTGSEMIIWGGRNLSFPYNENNGGRYFAAGDSWTSTAGANAPAERSDHTAIWTGYEMIVWGGGGIGNTRLNSMGRYIPSLDTWDGRPVVSVTAPTYNAGFPAPANIPVQANATDADGTIAHVDFFHNGTLIGTNAGAGPVFSFTWSNAPAGVHGLTAVAVDNLGAATTSSVVYVTVSALTGTPPTVALTSPSNAPVFRAPANVLLAANTADTDGNVVKVDFFRNALFIASVLTNGPTFQYLWQNVPAGTYTLTAVATDNSGLSTTSSPVVITASVPPVVLITNPLPAALLALSTNVPLGVSASDPDGSVTQVQYFDGLTPIVIANTPPFSAIWSNATAGAHTLTATATDSSGLITTSAPVSITLDALPIISITNPLPSSVSVLGVDVALGVNASDPDGSVTQVQYFDGLASIAVASAPPFSAIWSNATAGVHTLTATATDNSGFLATSAPVSITINAPPIVSITNPPAGTQLVAGGGLVVAAAASDPDGSIATVQIFADSVPVPPGGAGPFTAVWTNVALGTHALTAVATDNLGLSRTSAVVNVEAVLVPQLNVSKQGTKGAVLISLTGGETGRVYRLDVSSNLAGWLPWRTNLATNGTLSVIDSNSPPQTWRYYRAVP
ncbi:MAG: hypothetical protein HY301_12930 [Verrucomicrobia bacterium]|nr:hypothetical protein [Verrucomicrobiota bacterium]